jgi:hypothetical protein
MHWTPYVHNVKLTKVEYSRDLLTSRMSALFKKRKKQISFICAGLVLDSERAVYPKIPMTNLKLDQY